jgi:hypothetical protein
MNTRESWFNDPGVAQQWLNEIWVHVLSIFLMASSFFLKTNI